MYLYLLHTLYPLIVQVRIEVSRDTRDRSGLNSLGQTNGFRAQHSSSPSLAFDRK